MKFLIISAPQQGKLSYKPIHPGQNLSSAPAQTLITKGLAHPQGVAILQKTSKLLVADPDSKKILMYQLRSSGDTLSATPEGTAMNNVEARWVAVDGVGNVYATDEPSNRILKISAAQLEKGKVDPEVLYDGMSVTSVSGPGGIIADNFNAYWVNKQIGTQAGSLVKAAARPDAQNKIAMLEALTKNTDKSYGLCTAMGNIFYTQPDKTIFAVKKSGGRVEMVTDKLSKPRGCAWDGDGTVYVADRGANAVYTFPSNMETLSPALVQKAADVEDAFGVAVFAGSPRCASMALMVLVFCILQAVML
jgi:sugar lactone lactonase YvrE